MVNIMAAWNNDIQCSINSIELKNNKQMVINVPEHNKPDMSGCIKLAKSICNEVNSIHVMHGNVLVSNYVSGHNNKWQSIK